MLTTLLDLSLVIIAFGLIIFFHELGHFLAARWAGIRVIAFALGFGPAVASYRKGMGFRRGSSGAEYDRCLAEERAAGMSPTEYRLNYLPFGGYVKMLGQDDMDPRYVSTARDSYQSCKPWKRMVVISAGVVANLIIAATLFIIVFSLGLPTEPAKVGSIAPGSAASKAVASNASALGVTVPGLRPGDVIRTIRGKPATSFQDLVLASAMARPGAAIDLTVERAGVSAPLAFSMTPETSAISGMLELGIGPAYSTRVREFEPSERNLALWKAGTKRAGLTGIEPGMRLASVGPSVDEQTPATSAQDIADAIRAAGGKPITLAFAGADAQRILFVTIEPRGELEEADLDPDPKSVRIFEHIAGLAPVMIVALDPPEPPKQGLEPGDVFARLGATEYPSVPQGIAEIQSHKQRIIPVVVERAQGEGYTTRVSLSPRVTKAGVIGFTLGDTRHSSTLVALPPERLRPLSGETGEFVVPPAGAAIVRPGTRILQVNGAAVANFGEVRNAIVDAARAALPGDGDLQPPRATAITLTVSPSLEMEPGVPVPMETVTLTLSPDDVARIAALSWEPRFAIGEFFEMEETILKADNPLHAVGMGTAETHRWMMMTYATFVRLFEGSVKVEHLKGPVGIAHIGTVVASQGTLRLLFFLALVSVNLAVVNFLPLPIVDGGQFLFLVFEQIRGKPVPIAFQNLATLAGLALIGCMFLIVTFNDIRGLF